MSKMAINKVSIEKNQGDKFNFLSSFIEYALKNNFADTINYLEINSRRLAANLSLFVCLNLATKECFVFNHIKVQRNYLSFVLGSIKEVARKFSIGLDLSHFAMKILPEGELIGAEGPTKPDFIITVPILADGRPIAFLSFSKYGHLPLEENPILFTANFLSSLWERENREKTEKENIERLSLIDPLTGIFNRRAFYHIFPQDISEGHRNSAPFSLLVFDIDGFKQINDSHGHAFGDMVLKRVTSKFRSLLREEDTMFRLGGDEFAVILKTEMISALSAVQRILKEVSDSMSPRVTLSGGIVGINPYEDISADDAMKRADKALYLAKESGKNQVLPYSESKTKSDELSFDNVISQLTEDINFTIKESTARQLTSLLFNKKSIYIYERSITISDLAVQLGNKLRLSEKRLQNLRWGAILSDIGMMTVPEEILHETRKLTPEEYDVIKRHPIIGGRIIQRFPILRDVLPIVLYHHEWISGQGYPFGLAGDSIPLEARIVAVADAFHAMNNNRPYRSALTQEKSVSEIIKNRGTKYDPQVVEALLSTIDTKRVA